MVETCPSTASLCLFPPAPRVTSRDVLENALGLGFAPFVLLFSVSLQPEINTTFFLSCFVLSSFFSACYLNTKEKKGKNTIHHHSINQQCESTIAFTFACVHNLRSQHFLCFVCAGLTPKEVEENGFLSLSAHNVKQIHRLNLTFQQPQITRWGLKQAPSLLRDAQCSTTRAVTPHESRQVKARRVRHCTTHVFGRTDMDS